MRSAIFGAITLVAVVIVGMSIAACFTGIGVIPGLIGTFFGTRLMVAASGGIFGSPSEDDDYAV